MNQELMTLDFWQDTVIYEGKIFPIGTLACDALKYMEFAIKAATNSLQFEEIPNYADAMMLQRYTAVFGHLAYSLGEYQTAMLDFAEKSDGNEADRTAEGFARMFGSYFPPEFSITEGNAWMSTLNNSVQYVSVIRPGEKVAKLVKRIHYVSFVGMFRSDLFEGLCVGHAPKKCKICGKWFLTTNARHTTAPMRRRDLIISLLSLRMPYREKLPEVGSCNPQIKRIRVVLPAPFFPTKP